MTLYPIKSIAIIPYKWRQGGLHLLLTHQINKPKTSWHFICKTMETDEQHRECAEKTAKEYLQVNPKQLKFLSTVEVQSGSLINIVFGYIIETDRDPKNWGAWIDDSQFFGWKDAHQVLSCPHIKFFPELVNEFDVSNTEVFCEG